MNVELIRTYAETTDRKRKLDAELKELNKILDGMEEPVINEIAAAGVKNCPVVLEGGRTATVYVSRIVRARPKGEKGAVVEALKSIEDLAAIVAEGYNAQTLDAAVRERLGSGDPLWPELDAVVEIQETTRAGCTFEGPSDSASARATRAMARG